MGGKTKQAQRTKNNAKPSNSSRSAELLGVPTFVGFSAHSDLGLVPFAPGFATAEQMPDTFDASINPQFQLIMRKMSKKDPMTKKKALQEFIDIVQTSDIETVKSILPFWPKFYHNLAADTEHNVRELAQTALQLLVSKCKRAIAPYLKQLVPVWLVSHFDNYAPAATIASASFRETFAGNANRTQEVCLHCQTEIVEFVTRNVTFHTAATLSSGKSLAPEEAEQKYQRTIVCSLRALSFFVEHTKNADLSQIHAAIQALLAHQKFWSFAKHKIPQIKAAWFELIYNLLQHPSLSNVVLQVKTQIITVCFQNIDESDPVAAPQVWGCILLVQSNYDDWHSGLCFKKTVLPKISTLLRNNFNHNAQAICPNLLPFFSKLSPECLPDVSWHEFCKQFFDDFKSAICLQSDGATLSKAECSIIVKSYFECLRFLLQKLNSAASSAEEAFAKQLLEENVLELVEWSMNVDNVTVKFIYQQIAALAAFWTERQQSGNSSLYTKLLDAFWKRIFQLITKGIEKKEYMERILELVQSLHSANPSLDDQRVKFAESEAVAAEKSDDLPRIVEERKPTANESTAAFIQKELKELVVQLVRLCLDNVEKGSSAKCMQSVRRLTKMFPDAEFYASITDKKSLLDTLKLFVGLIGTVDEEACEVVVDIVFEILQFIDKPQRFEYIKSNLLVIPQANVQSLVLQRLLSYPLCVEPEMQLLLSGPEASAIIVNVARGIFANKSQEQLNLLHKCFFQNDAGEILIATPTVDALLRIVAEPLDDTELGEMADACGSFIAQIMPVICSNGNASDDMQREIFLKLFKFSMERTVNEFISQDTLWEMTTCWEDALSSEDITIDESLLRMCADVVEQRLQADELSAAAINGMADSIAKFIICSTENIEAEERLEKIDTTMLGFWHTDEKMMAAVEKMAQHCLFLEALQGSVSTDMELCDIGVTDIDMRSIYRRTLLKFCTIFKLVCKTSDAQKVIDAENVDDEATEDYCDPNEDLLKHWSDVLYAEILHCIHIASVGGSLVNNVSVIDTDVEMLMLELVETVVAFMRNECEIVGNVKERLLQESAKEVDIMPSRSLTFLVHYQQYAQFEENATILLAEELSEYFIGKNALRAYVNSLQYLLPKLEPRSITSQSAIMRTEPSSMWIKSAVFRCLVNNNFSADYNEKSDKNIVVSVLQFVTEIAEKQHSQKDLLLYNIDIEQQSYVAVVDVVEYVNLLTTVLQKFPHELTIKNWDAIRIGLSSWVLSVSKSIEAYTNPKVALFIASVYRLFAALTKFIISEKQRSSTELLKNVIDEWETLFVREVTLVLFKAFYSLSNAQDPDPVKDVECYIAILEEITPAIELLDYGIVYNFCKSSTKITLDNVCNFLLKNLSNPIHSMRITCVYILRQLTRFFVTDDIAIFEKKSETLEDQSQISKWHYLNRFEDYLARYDFPIQKYLKEFSFKVTEVADFEPIDRNEAFSYLLLWDCIIYACANSPVSLRSVYTSWLNENKYEENLLHFLFRAMPVEILKNHDSKIMNSDIFKGLTWMQITDRNLSLEKYVCHLYAEVLRKLPAVVRKWWNTSPSRQKAFVDKLTTNFVSPLICIEELKSIGNKKEKHENMQVNVHMSTREVLAVYSIDEARMELVITLAPNYPLGAVKVECGKQIGGRSSSRNVGMQLTIFLTHQNGTIFDGLTLWKNNLDKKFEGVEECYVCYTVIHQDTCQLPKLTCKTCKKKFHGPCLYKWFTTSSKSTCPICRNVF